MSERDEQVFHSTLRTATAHASTILDVGGGTGRMRRLYPFAARVHVVDACMTDLLKYEDAATKLCGLAQDVLPILADHMFDVVLGLDFIEHLELPEARLVLAQMKRVARGRVCLFVPEGEHPQPGTRENPWQQHRATWNRGMLEALEFKVTLWPHFHSEPGKAPGAMWATWAW